MHTLNVLRDTLPDPRRALTLRVRPNTLHLLQQLLRALQYIPLIPQTTQQHILVLKQRWVLQQTRHLTEECNGLLIQLLRVPNVRCDNGVEGKVLALAFCQCGAVLLRLDG